MPSSPAVLSTIRAELARRSLGQKDLAGVLGISQAGVSERMRGITPLRVDELLAIAEFLDVPPSTLLGPEQVSA